MDERKEKESLILCNKQCITFQTNKIQKKMIA